eukprot:TRINITY_DN3168_c0_g1_i5.p1 TRINITY_DN3168_c0_g1~~TRINITY_DN3168_c0_g1_i5.p1  ORF type:complete len:585 (+),score=54.93 TRINITY_DN3168_c0_g1_i5:153-1907(+)
MFDVLESQVADAHLVRRLSNEFPSPPLELDLKPIEELKHYVERVNNYEWAEISKQPAAVYQFHLYLRENGMDDLVQFLEQVEKYARCTSFETKSPDPFTPAPHPEEKDRDKEKDDRFNQLDEFAEMPRKVVGQVIFRRFLEYDENKTNKLKHDQPQVIEAIRNRLNDDPPVDLFAPVVDAIQNTLIGMIPAFKQSTYYQTFAQYQEFCRRPKNEENFLKIRILGRGAFGAVHAVSHTATHRVYACKEMLKKQIKKQNLYRLVVNERNALASLDNFFVLHLKSAFQTPSHLMLLFDICSGGDLRYHLRHRPPGRFSIERTRFYAAEILLGLEHLHSRGFIYRDLKPDNILLEEHGHCRISDLGLAVKLQEGQTLRELAGTAGYWAPEVVARQPYSFPADWFSYGCVLYEFATGHPPKCRCQSEKEWCCFNPSAAHEALAKSGDKNFRLDVDYPEETFPQPLADLLRRLLVQDPDQRLTPEQIRAHPFFAPINWARLQALEIPPPYKPNPHLVHAKMMHEVGELDESRYTKVELTESDQKSYHQWEFNHDAGFQKDLVAALRKAEHFDKRRALTGEQNVNPCCGIL